MTLLGKKAQWHRRNHFDFESFRGVREGRGESIETVVDAPASVGSPGTLLLWITANDTKDLAALKALAAKIRSDSPKEKP